MGDRSQRTTGLGWTALGCGVAVLVLGVVSLGAVALWLGSWNGWSFSIRSSPGDGTRSERLAVSVEPAVDLTPGAVVTVTSDAFEPHQVVGVAVCLERADTLSAGVDACDEVSGARFAVSATGHLAATFAVPRVITVAGVAHDCAAAGVSCLVVAADASDYDKSGGRPVTFRTDLGPPDLVPVTRRAPSLRLPTLPASVDGAAPDAVVQVTASGFQPGEPVVLARCAGFPAAEALQACDPVDDEAAGALITRNTRRVTRHADDTGTASFSFTVIAQVTPPLNDDAPVSCTSPAAACSLVIAAAADTQRSAVVPYTVTP